MAKKTDAEIGNKVRSMVTDAGLESYETIKSVKIIVTVEVDDDRGKTYSKGTKGVSFGNYDADDETLEDSW